MKLSTEIVHLTSRYTKQCPILGIAVDDIVITPKPAARDLGVILDSHQGKKLSFHSTCPLDEYFSDFGRPNVKCTRPKYVMIKDRLTKTYKFATSFSFNR